MINSATATNAKDSSELSKRSFSYLLSFIEPFLQPLHSRLRKPLQHAYLPGGGDQGSLTRDMARRESLLHQRAQLYSSHGLLSWCFASHHCGTGLMHGVQGVPKRHPRTNSSISSTHPRRDGFSNVCHGSVVPRTPDLLRCHCPPHTLDSPKASGTAPHEDFPADVSHRQGNP